MKLRESLGALAFTSALAACGAPQQVQPDTMTVIIDSPMVTVNGGETAGEPVRTTVRLPYVPQINVTNEATESHFSNDIARIRTELGLYEAATVQLNNTNTAYESLIEEGRNLARRDLENTRTRVSEGYDQEQEHRTVVHHIELEEHQASKHWRILQAMQRYATLLATLEQAQMSLQDLLSRAGNYHPIYDEAGNVTGSRNSEQQEEWLQSQIERLNEQFNEASMQNDQALMGITAAELITLQDALDILTSQADCIADYTPSIQVTEFPVGQEPTVMTIVTEAGNAFRVCMDGLGPMGRTQTAGHDWHADVLEAIAGVSSDLDISEDVATAEREAVILGQRADRATSGTSVDLPGPRRTAEELQGPITQVPNNAVQ